MLDIYSNWYKIPAQTWEMFTTESDSGIIETMICNEYKFLKILVDISYKILRSFYKLRLIFEYWSPKIIEFLFLPQNSCQIQFSSSF